MKLSSNNHVNLLICYSCQQEDLNYCSTLSNPKNYNPLTNIFDINLIFINSIVSNFRS